MGQERTRAIAQNRKAFHDYELMERVEAGLALMGTEIKSVRAARVNLRNAYARSEDGELWLHQLHIAPWPGAGPWDHDPLRPRKLLLHRKEIQRLARGVNAQGLTLVPLRLYIRGHRAKVELALARGRRRYDKRQAIKKRESERDMARAFRSRR